MKKVNTVLGPIRPEEVGIANLHEHLVWANAGWQYSPEANKLFNYPEVFSKLHNVLKDYKNAGGNTIVDCSGISMGRDVNLYASLAQASGVNIVACTGFWAQENIVPYFLSKDIDYLEALFIKELTQGMGTTGIKAGVIKVGNGKEGVKPFEEKTYRAAARASKATGAAIITHGINGAFRQVEILLEEKVDPERAVISHCCSGYNLNFERDKEFARQGFNVGYDLIGYEPEWSPMPYALSDARKVELCQAFIAAGCAHKLVLSCNAEPMPVGWGEKGAAKMHGYAHLLTSFVPRLKAAGIAEATIQAILVEKPKELLPF